MTLPLPNTPPHQPHPGPAHSIRFIVAGVAIVMIAAVAWQIHQAGERRATEPQHIVLVDPDLLPPLPEPEQEQKQEVIEEDNIEMLEEDFQDSAPDDPGESMDDDLGLDSAADAGGDSFGLRAKRGGRSLVDLANSGQGNPYAGYLNAITSGLKTVFDRHAALKSSYYTIDFYLWITHQGYVQRFEIIKSSANTSINRELEQLLLSADVFFSAPPEDLEQPIALRLIANQ